MTPSTRSSYAAREKVGPGRSLLLGLGIALWTAFLGGAIVPLLAAGRPAKGVRSVTRLWARGVLVLVRRIGGIDHVVEGKANLPQVPCLILCNHQSAWETIAALVLFPDVAIVAKRELLGIPVFGWYLRHSPMIIIDRAASLESIRVMARESAGAVAEGRSVLIFPEGTRVDPHKPIRFKRGVEHLLRAVRAPVVPVVHDAGRYWRRDGKVRGTIVVKILPPLDGMAAPKLLARHAEQAMNAEVGQAGQAHLGIDPARQG